MSTGSDALFSLRGRRILVTGAGRGLGRGIAVGCAVAGAEVIGLARSDDQLQDTAAAVAAAGGRFSALGADLAAAGDGEEIVERAMRSGPLWGVIHGGGGQVRKPAVDVTVQDWQRVHDVHLRASFFLSTAIARRQMIGGSGGSHVFIGSLGSSLGIARASPYTAAKAGIVGLARVLAVEWAAQGIRVNAIGPGYFHTALTTDLLADPEQHRRVLSRIPMRRLGTADDLVGAAVFLLSDASAYMTGQLLNVDGGWLAA